MESPTFHFGDLLSGLMHARVLRVKEKCKIEQETIDEGDEGGRVSSQHLKEREDDEFETESTPLISPSKGREKLNGLERAELAWMTIDT